MAQVEATSRIETTFPFECGCGYEGVARVTGRGFTTVDEGAALFRNHHAKEMALDHAEGLAWADALSSVELAPCPRCGHRDRGRWQTWIGAIAVPVVTWGVLGGVVTVLGTFLLRQRLDHWPLVCGLVAGPLVGFGVFWFKVSRKRKASAALSFDPVR